MRPVQAGGVRWQTVVAVLALFLAGASLGARVCFSSGFRWGLWASQCPDGEPRQLVTVDAQGLTRGARARVRVQADAVFAVQGEATASLPVKSFQPSFSLVSAGQETPLPPAAAWAPSGAGLSAELELPRVNDGEYTLRTRVASRLGESTLDLPLALYTPAAVHVLTDRPLYEPGNTVQFRALALRASDLTPLEERPGWWRVVDPQGEVLLEEKAPSGRWGVVAGTFPLDRGASSGEWTVTWASGGTEGSRRFTVKPFTLPRFSVEAAPTRPFFRKGERPALKGTVRYASGAPVAKAQVALEWGFSGEWPPPTAWADGSALPRAATTDASGGFTVELPAVPADLQGQARATARLSAVDPAGDRVEGAAQLLLSEDAIQVSAVTELADGLSEGFNNRLYLRAATADGRPLPGVALEVKRLWEPGDKGLLAEVDEDGVAQLQVDPGPAVNVVVPAPPFRPPPPTPAVSLEELSDRLASQEADGDVTLADRMRVEALLPRLQPCARFTRGGGERLQVGLLVQAQGAVASLAAPATPLGRCVGRALEGVRFEAGRPRFLDATWAFDDAELPRFQVQLDGLPVVPPGLLPAVEEALLGARECLPATVRSGPLPALLTWRREAGAAEVKGTWVPAKGQALGAATLACVTGKVGRLPLPAAKDGPTAVGVAHVAVTAPARFEADRPQDTVQVGYEFLVTARRAGASLGATRLRVGPGTVPPIRLRASQQVVDPGAQVTVELVRGPDFTGTLPETLTLRHAFQTVDGKVDPETRKATLTVPSTWQGWASVAWGGGQVFFFVRSRTPLAVSLSPERPRYAPGQVAHLSLDTRVAGAPAEAAVGLFGVDESLAQLAPLPGVDELASLRPRASQGRPGLPGLDAQALALGRVRGANAAAATLLGLDALPPPPEVEAAVRVRGQTQHDPNAILVDHFYGVLAEVASQVRAWEAGAPPKEKLTPATMAGLWTRALTAAERRGEPTRDAWGRPLRLHRLPADLLALVDPRALVVNGTRLPEDTQNWARWVMKERP